MSTFVNKYPAETFYRLLQLGWSGNSGIQDQPVYIQDGTGGNTSLSIDNKNLTVGISMTSLGNRQYSLSVGEANSQDSNASLQVGFSLVQNGDINYQFGSLSTQGGSYNFQAGYYNTQSGFATFQAGSFLDDARLQNVYMFGNAKTANVDNRAYFSITNGIWIYPGITPPVLESGCLWYHNVSGLCTYISGQARRIAVI